MKVKNIDFYFEEKQFPLAPPLAPEQLQGAVSVMFEDDTLKVGSCTRADFGLVAARLINEKMSEEYQADYDKSARYDQAGEE